MASAAAAAGLSEDALRSLFGGPGAVGALPGVFLILPPRTDGRGVRVLGHLVKHRAGGFMVCLPDDSEVADYLRELGTEEGVEAAAVHPVEVDMETPRGRLLGLGACLLVDCVWSHSNLFMRAHALRNQSLYKVIRFGFDGQACRPRRQSTEEAAVSWINEVMDSETAAEYLTAEEPEELIPDEAYTPSPVGGPAAESEMEMLRRRLAELENRPITGDQSFGVQRVPLQQHPPPPPRPTGVLFSSAPYQIPAGFDPRERLQQLAAAAPMRLGVHEKEWRENRPEQILEALQQEGGLEATEQTELEDGIKELEAGLVDPMQRLLLLQMKQMNLLAKQQQVKATDPIHQALSGTGGSDSSTGGGGIKGCLAREAYIKVASDLERVGEIVLQNAAQELGVDPLSVHPGLMRDFIEKRSPLGDQRLLVQMAYMFANGWEVAFRSGNKQMLGFCSRGLVFIDQSAIDYGRTTLAWLLTSLPEPAFSVVQRNRHRQSMSPFTRLAQPSWISANVAYMRELDFLEGKIKAANTSNALPPQVKENVDEAAPKKKWKPKRKGKEDAGSSSAT